MPRAPLAARFGDTLLSRLDQALGRADEAISPLSPVRAYSVRSVFPEPISLLADIEHIARDLSFRLCPQLEGDGRGAKGFVLKLFGTDGSVREISVASARLLFKPEKLAALFHERIHRVEAFYDPGTGVDALSLDASHVESLQAVQKPLGLERDQGGEGFSFLVDRLTARLGAHAIGRMAPRESHVPERAQRRAGLDEKRAAGRWPDAPRPLLLLPRPEPITVMAEIPDGPPALFTWRRVRRRVAYADGPERIAQEWWRGAPAPTRDYFRIEDEEHRRYWLYRDGLYGIETASPRWYMHGLFP
jgi:protein ImuB